MANPDAGNLTIRTFGLLIGFIALSGFGQIFMKIGIRGEQIPVSRSPIRTFLNIVSFMLRPYVFLGLCLYVFGAFTWLLLISNVRLSVAYPMISIGYGLVTVLSVWILHEKVKWKYAIPGLLLIAAGVSFIGFGMRH